MILEDDFPLNKLAEVEEMSVRATGVCFNAGLNTLSKILEFYQKGNSFLELKNCGQRTQNELVFICKKYLGDHFDRRLAIALPFIDETIKIVGGFDPFKKATLNHFANYLISQLTVRARNGLINHFGDTFNINDTIEKIYDVNFDFRHLKNIGEKTTLELIEFKRRLSSFISTLESIKQEKLALEYTKLLIKTTFQALPLNTDDFIESCLNSNGKIELFKLLQWLIQQDKIFGRNEKQIFFYCFNKKSDKSIEQIAATLDVGKERARQIKVALENDIQSYFQFILNLREVDIQPYIDKTNDASFTISEDFTDKINQLEDVNFNIKFYCVIISLLLEKTHSTIGYDDVLSSKNKLTNSSRFSNIYLIRRELTASFDFISLVNTVNEMLNDKIVEEYSLYLNGFLMQFKRGDLKADLDLLKKVCEEMLFNEFQLVINPEGYLVFERNTKKPLSQYVFEVLEQKNQLTKVEDIAKLVIEMFPHVECSEQAVRSALQKERELFIFIGRSSTYGLRKWQEERENLKGGTIRDIVEEYLESQSEPKHISEITDYVLKFRDTNESNVRTNIELEENGRFQFFKGHFIGLRGKNYQDVEKFKRVYGTHFRLVMFENMDGWDLNDVINFFVVNYEYHPKQVKSLIEKKIEAGDLFLTNDNKLKL